MGYIGTTYKSSRDCFANSITGTKDLSFEIYKGDTFTVKRKILDSHLYVAVYNGPRNADRITSEFGVCEEFMDDCCTVAGMKKQEPPCHCSSIDIASIGHLPDCEFKRAGGCGGNQIFKVR